MNLIAPVVSKTGGAFNFNPQYPTAGTYTMVECTCTFEMFKDIIDAEQVVSMTYLKSKKKDAEFYRKKAGKKEEEKMPL